VRELSQTTSGPADELAAVVRTEWPRLAALLVAQFRRLDLVEDALGDAVERAVATWPERGVPRNPAAWLLTAARRRMLDVLRAETVAARKQPLLRVDAEVQQHAAGERADPGDLIGDEVLRLVLMCTHPVLSREAAAALSLRLVLGISTPDIAALFLVSPATMGARLTRAKRRIVALGVPLASPDATTLPSRVEAVAEVAYLAFTAGYAPASGREVVRVRTAGEAVRLVRVTLDSRPGEPVLLALLALLLLQHSRRDSRIDPDGAPVLLPDQDRTRWHHDEITEGLELVGHLLHQGDAIAGAARGYLLQALVAAEHAVAARPEETRWDRICGHYLELERHTGSAVVRLNRAVAVAEARGPEAGLALLEGLDQALPEGHRLPATRAVLLERAGRTVEALAAYDVALARCRHDAERALLARRRDALHR
jgi:RNA polymerase sigma-70 factor (ECF subfamily)